MTKTNFDVINVPLKGTNLIEASAGTGKTYSIAILVIRLIIEKRIALKEILMVTFTKAAVSELEVRIRKFIRESYSYINQDTEVDKTIKAIIDNGIAAIGKTAVLNLLNKARRQLDETAIYTIHGFCQKTLSSSAFETGQAFNSEVIEDEASFINAATNEYWRANISTLDTELLVFLLAHGLSKNKLSHVVSKAIRGKQFIYNTQHTIGEYWTQKQEAQQDLDTAIAAFNMTFNDSPERTIAHIGDKGHAHKAFAHLLDNAASFRKTLIAKKGTAYVAKKFPVLLEAALKIDALEQLISALGQDATNYLYGGAIAYCATSIQQKKQEQSLFSFDDLINKLHDALSSEALQWAMRREYKAVFIDEFQDTDQKQYEIFHTFFNGHAILFYIGDPKQSIYSFKGTDIDTYLAAAQQADYSYTMSHNYRSTAAYIEAMNTFFGSIDRPFHDPRITYENVKAGLALQNITLSGNAVAPLAVYKCHNLTEITQQVTHQVKALLLDDYQLNGRKIKPSDIGILVRANAKGKEIKQALSKYNIPAITIDDSRVLESGESTLLLYLLKAIFEPNKHTINRVLWTYLTHKTKQDLLSFDIEMDVEFFKAMNTTWREKGVFSAINAFMDNYHTLEHIQAIRTNDAERVISNILQINEILHNKEKQSKSSPKDLIHWLETVIAGGEESGEYSQRLENDEDAVKIVTIHKSKGLAYNIVIAPYLDMKSDHNMKWDFIEYKDPEKNTYCFSPQVTPEASALYAQQAERENRRLIYVALTRAVYMGIIMHKPKDQCGIKAFIDGAIAQNHLNYSTNLERDNRRYNATRVDIDKIPKKASLSPINSTWSNYSFSMLSQYTPHHLPEAIAKTEGYDQFIFEQFPKGALAGNLMHFLFENIDFTANDFTAAIVKALNRYKSVFATANEGLEQNITTMLHHVLEAQIPTQTPFTLSQLENDNRLPEVAFDFKMKEFSTPQLQALLPNIDLAREGNIQGMMSGFIDLLFEHQGQFYILDWKSNYLGNSTEDYTSEKLDAAMQESNYHLQYYIYTIATKLYLEHCVPHFDYDQHFGGVIYVYARGCRQGANSGVYFAKPELGLVARLENLLCR